MAAPTYWKLYNATELTQMLSKMEKLISQAKKVISTGETNALAHAKAGNLPSQANRIGEVAFRDAGQLILQAMQLVADTQGKDLTTLSGDELDDFAANGFRWGNIATIGSPTHFDFFSAFTIVGNILGGADAATGFLTFTGISEAKRHDVSAGYEHVDPFESINVGRVIKLVTFPDLESGQASGATWGTIAGNAFPLDADNGKDQVEQGKIFEVKSKGTWSGNLAAPGRGQHADTEDVLHDNLLPVLKVNEKFIRFDFLPSDVTAIDDVASLNAPVSNSPMLMREIATTVAGVHRSGT